MDVEKHYDFEVRIAYADTDRMGVVYYANYLVLFERGRTEFMRNAGLRYRDLEEKQRLFMPVMEAHVDYLAPARYDDLIRVRTFLAALGGAHVIFRHEIYLVETGALVSRGHTKHAVVNLLWRPTRFPDDLRQMLQPYLSN
jgi:acyl-CoA thioester hydrolase